MIKVLTVSLLTATTFSIFNSVNEFNRALPTPVQISEDSKLTETKKALTLLGKDLKFAEPIYISAKIGNIDPVLWACNIQAESEFKINAKSPKGYKGLGQTPKAVMKTGYETADLVYAASVYKEKLSIAKGNPKLALTLYKGGNNSYAKKDAEKVYKLYAKIREQMNS